MLHPIHPPPPQGGKGGGVWGSKFCVLNMAQQDFPNIARWATGLTDGSGAQLRA